MRNDWTKALGKRITSMWGQFIGSKVEFMASIPEVTSDQRSEPSGPYPSLGIMKVQQAYYCTFIYEGKIIECYSYDDEPDWWCKN